MRTEMNVNRTVYCRGRDPQRRVEICPCASVAMQPTYVAEIWQRSARLRDTILTQCVWSRPSVLHNKVCSHRQTSCVAQTGDVCLRSVSPWMLTFGNWNFPHSLVLMPLNEGTYTIYILYGIVIWFFECMCKTIISHWNHFKKKNTQKGNL